MKKCEICQKPSADLVKTLTTGPNGFRRYKVCPACRKDKAPAELDSDATYRKFAQAVGPSAKALSTQEKRAAIADLKQRKDKAPAELKQGTQIAYVPTHAGGDILHPDVELGFVVSRRNGSYFCRYWRKGHPGELRTLANSELTPGTLIVEHKSVPQVVVKKWLVEIGVRES